MKPKGIYMKPMKKIITPAAKPPEMIKKGFEKIELPKELKKTEKIMKPKTQSLTWKSLIAGLIAMVLTFVVKAVLPESIQEPAQNVVEWILKLIFGASTLGMLWGIRRAKGDIQ